MPSSINMRRPRMCVPVSSTTSMRFRSFLWRLGCMGPKWSLASRGLRASDDAPDLTWTKRKRASTRQNESRSCCSNQAYRCVIFHLVSVLFTQSG